MRVLSILGSTGSIGRQTLEVARAHADQIRVAALAAGSRVDALAEQAQAFSPSFVALPDAETEKAFKAKAGPFRGETGYGLPALAHAATLAEVTHVVVAVVGSLGLRPTLAALESGKVVALANKETLVAGGHLVTETLQRKNGAIIPIDSEHSAIFQCLRGENIKEVRSILLTASGGPFRGATREALRHVTKNQVLAHPIWKMGNKITVDSASLMNKGLEVIEAKWLFGLSPDQVRIVVHPQGIVHSLVEFVDGSVMAQLGLPDMRTPIQVALSHPERWPSFTPQLNLTEMKALTFEEPDFETFPVLKDAYRAAREGGTLPGVLNAANEEAVRLFLDDKIRFYEIPELIHLAMNAHENLSMPDLDQVLEADRWARSFVAERGARGAALHD